MRLHRKGSYRDLGWSQLINEREERVKKKTVHWDKEGRCVSVTVSQISDLYSDSTWEYRVDLSLDDIGDIVEVLATNAIPGSTGQDSPLAPHAQALFKLLGIAIGYVPVEPSPGSKT